MPNLTSNDIKVAVQRATCCSADLAVKVAKEYSYSLKCAKWHLQDLKLLHAYIELLTDYPIINTIGVQASGTATISGTVGSIRLEVNNAPVSAIVAFNASLATTAEDLKNSINSYASIPFDYTATHTLGTSIVTVIAPEGTGSIPNDYLITATVTGDMVLNGDTSTLRMVGGSPIIVTGDGCITEIEALNIIENISRVCEICLAPPGVTYK